MGWVARQQAHIARGDQAAAVQTGNGSPVELSPDTDRPPPLPVQCRDADFARAG